MKIKKSKRTNQDEPRRRRRSGRQGNWPELFFFLLTAAGMYFILAFFGSSWTGETGRVLGEYLRKTWGGAALVPLLFWVYLCLAGLVRFRVPRPLGQMLGTAQLYLSLAFMLGLARQTGWNPSWSILEPGEPGAALARFFVLNLGVLGAVLAAVVSFLLAAIFYRSRLLFLLLAAHLEMQEKRRQRKELHEEPASFEPEDEDNKDNEDYEDSYFYENYEKEEKDSPGQGQREKVKRAARRREPEHKDTPDMAAFVSPSPVPPVLPSRSKASESVPDEPDKKEKKNEGRQGPAMPAPSVPPAHVPSRSETDTPAPADGPVSRINRTGPTISEVFQKLLVSLDSISIPDRLLKPLDDGPAPRRTGTRRPRPAVWETEKEETESVKGLGRQAKEHKDYKEHKEREEKPDEEDGNEHEQEGPGERFSYPGAFPPPPELFGPPVEDKGDSEIMAEAKKQGGIIIGTLKNFGISASVAHIVIGPSVIQFQLELASGTRVNKVSGLTSDLTMALAVVSVRVEAPILGQPYVGVEIPNPGRRGIPLRAALESDEFKNCGAALPLPMGMQVDSRFLICGLEDMPHMLVAGTTGSGKSVFVNNCILGMCSRRTPDELRLILIDPKHVEFAIYEGLPHLLARPISEPRGAIDALAWAVQEMERRTESFARARVRNLELYNKKMPENRFPNIAIVVDELADLMYTAGRDAENLIVRLAQKARAAGIYLILATQRPSVDVITGLIKANVPARVAFALPSQTDSRTIIDTPGAEKLLGRGDMLFLSSRFPRPVRLQSPFITEERTLDFVEYMKSIFGEPDYIEFEESGAGISRDAGRETVRGTGGAEAVNDPRMEEAIRVVTEMGVTSVSGLQQLLGVGYPKARRLLSGMEYLGILGPQSSGSKNNRPRDILMDGNSAYEALERARSVSDSPSGSDEEY